MLIAHKSTKTLSDCKSESSSYANCPSYCPADNIRALETNK